MCSTVSYSLKHSSITSFGFPLILKTLIVRPLGQTAQTADRNLTSHFFSFPTQTLNKDTNRPSNICRTNTNIPLHSQGPGPLSDRVMITQVNKQLRSWGWTALKPWINGMLKHCHTVCKQWALHKGEGKQQVTSLKISLKRKNHTQCTFQQNSFGLQRYSECCTEILWTWVHWMILHVVQSHTVFDGGDNRWWNCPSFLHNLATSYGKLWW